ncbi:MAG TPA: helix-turn-helix domain-containing protein, partial [Thermoanaerobaculia bacterium]|nr:helix-turn-helix domain-containing protein [Thermoanaerobaculia bacterium]
MSYSVREVSAMLGLSATQIRAYASKGFLQPERGARGELRFGFHDLVILRTAGELAAANVPQRKVQRVLQQLRDQLPKGQSLTGIRIAANGNEVVVREGGSSWNPESGQILLDFSVEDLAEKTAAIDNARSPEVDEMYELACEIESSSPGQAREIYQRLLHLQPDHVD